MCPEGPEAVAYKISFSSGLRPFLYKPGVLSKDGQRREHRALLLGGAHRLHRCDGAGGVRDDGGEPRVDVQAKATRR